MYIFIEKMPVDLVKKQQIVMLLLRWINVHHRGIKFAFLYDYAGAGKMPFADAVCKTEATDKW